MNVLAQAAQCDQTTWPEVVGISIVFTVTALLVAFMVWCSTR